MIPAKPQSLPVMHSMAGRKGRSGRTDSLKISLKFGDQGKAVEQFLLIEGSYQACLSLLLPLWIEDHDRRRPGDLEVAHQGALLSAVVGHIDLQQGDAIGAP